MAAAGLAVPDAMQGRPLPKVSGDASRERVLTEWIDTYDDNEIIMRSMVYKDHLITAYAKSNRYNGTEGELYVLSADPNQWCNLWNDPGYVSLKADLLADMNDNVPEGRNTALEKIAPV